MSKQDQTSAFKDPPYLGMYLKKFVPEEVRYKRWKKRHGNKIFLYSPVLYNDDKSMAKLNQVVNVYEHNMDDFEFNAKRIIDHYKLYYGSTSTWMYTLGQTILFRVYPEQKEPFSLSLFQFFVNYTTLVIPICCGADMTKWRPLTGEHISPDKWVERINKHIRMVRNLANMRKINECIDQSKFLLKIFLEEVGDRTGLSISNNEFINVMKRSEEARKSITCTFDIPDDITPTDMEALTAGRTKDLLNFISTQADLSLSNYARNNLLNPTQFRECAVHMTYKPNLQGSTIPFTQNTNIIMGIKDPRAFVIDASGGRKAEIIKLNVSDAGTLERALMMLMDPVRKVDVNYMCNSQHFRKRTINTITDLEKIEGRVICTNPKAELHDQRYWVVDVNDTDLIGKTVHMKTPITCTHPQRSEGVICAACYGLLMSRLNNDVHIGKIAAEIQLMRSSRSCCLLNMHLTPIQTVLSSAMSSMSILNSAMDPLSSMSTFWRCPMLWIPLLSLSTCTLNSIPIL
ncbi:MAG: hypothetical protein K2F99_05870 [Muribaculaceae bacterium]|nr:hypothetical protein [Muribaculaceae bacterium]